MRGKLGSLCLLLIAAAALGVPGAGGRSLAITKLIVQVVGEGTAQDSAAQINCGFNAVATPPVSKRCYATYDTTGSGTVHLTATPASGWTFLNWTGDDNSCTG